MADCEGGLPGLSVAKLGRRGCLQVLTLLRRAVFAGRRRPDPPPGDVHHAGWIELSGFGRRNDLHDGSAKLYLRGLHAGRSRVCPHARQRTRLSEVRPRLRTEATGRRKTYLGGGCGRALRPLRSLDRAVVVAEGQVPAKGRANQEEQSGGAQSEQNDVQQVLNEENSGDDAD